jgi:hypothetical protein
MTYGRIWFSRIGMDGPVPPEETKCDPMRLSDGNRLGIGPIDQTPAAASRLGIWVCTGHGLASMATTCRRFATVTMGKFKDLWVRRH